MTLKKVRIPVIALIGILFLFSLSNMALSPARTFLQLATSTSTATPGKIKPTHLSPVTATPTASPGKIKPTPIPLEAQAGHTDGIVLIGILIVIIIIVPILIQGRNPLKKSAPK